MNLELAIVIGMIICALVGSVIGFMSARSYYREHKGGK